MFIDVDILLCNSVTKIKTPRKFHFICSAVNIGKKEGKNDDKIDVPLPAGRP